MNHPKMLYPNLTVMGSPITITDEDITRKFITASSLLRYLLNQRSDYYNSNPHPDRVFEKIGHNYKTYRDYTPRYNLVKPDRPKKDDIQCIVGAKVIRLTNNYVSKNIPDSFCHSYESYMLPTYIQRVVNNKTSGPESRKFLSVIYIHRKDGTINHDVYFRWCKETSLPFPDDLIHTEYDIDENLSGNKNLDRGTKAHYTELGLIDSIRHKKRFLWCIPFMNNRTRNINRDNIKMFSKMSKSSAKRPWTIDTYAKRKQRRDKRNARNQHR